MIPKVVKKRKKKPSPVYHVAREKTKRRLPREQSYGWLNAFRTQTGQKIPGPFPPQIHQVVIMGALLGTKNLFPPRRASLMSRFELERITATDASNPDLDCPQRRQLPRRFRRTIPWHINLLASKERGTARQSSRPSPVI